MILKRKGDGQARLCKNLVMKLFKNKFRVESSRLKDWDYSTPWWYYVTICTKDKQCWFGEVKNGKMHLNDVGKIVDEEWNKTKEIRKNVDLDYYVIMPNHFHGIIIINNVETSRRDVSKGRETGHRPVSTQLQPNSLGSIIGQFKSVCTKQIHLSGNSTFKWQSRFYDHIIRNENDLRRIRTYIQYNPLKWEIDEYFR
jgi:REP element-mobilizing transposase RayT